MPSRAPSIGTCFALAVVLAAVAALTIPQAGADVVNELVERLTAESEASSNAGPGEDHDRAPRLRQPSGWGEQNYPQTEPPLAETTNQQQPPTQNNTDASPKNETPPAETPGQQSNGELQTSTPGTNQGASTVPPPRGGPLGNATLENSATSGNQVAPPDAWPPNANIAGNVAADQPSQPEQLPEVLTRDWSDAPNRSLMSRAELASSGGAENGGQKHTLLDAITPTASGLAIVIGLFLLCTWMLRKKLPKLVGALPSDVFEVLGKTTLDKKNKLHLVRCGGKLALLSVSSAGIETVMEIDQPDEVTRITGMCHELRAGSSTADFREVLSELNNEPARGWPKRGNARRGSV